MVSPKKFSTFDEQIELLKSEKHLIITDETYAKDILMPFNEIVTLYEFDPNLRELFYNIIPLNSYFFFKILKRSILYFHIYLNIWSIAFLLYFRIQFRRVCLIKFISSTKWLLHRL